MALTWKWFFTPPSTTTNTHTNTMFALSQLVKNQLWPKFKGRFLGTSRTDFNCNGDICPGNICPRTIYLYLNFLSCYWPNFDQTSKVGFWDHLWQMPPITATFVHQNMSGFPLPQKKFAHIFLFDISGSWPLQTWGP